MAWLRVDVNLIDHRKLRILAKTLGVDPNYAIGLLIRLWSRVLMTNEDGNVSKWSSDDIAHASQWTGDSETYFKALVNDGDGWIDVSKKGKFIHDWNEYTYKYMYDKYHTSYPEKVRKPKGQPKGQPKGRLQDGQRDKRDKKDIYIVHFEEIWNDYPAPRVGKKAALMMFKRTVTKEEDIPLIKKALLNYKNSRRVHNGFVQNGGTWFNNWRDWLDYDETKSEEGIYQKL